MIAPAAAPSPALAELFAVAAGASPAPPLDLEIDEPQAVAVAIDAEQVSTKAPREVRFLTDAELLAIILDGGAPSPQARSAAATLARLPRSGRELGVDGLVAEHHLPRGWATQLSCAYELARRHPGYDDAPKVECLNDALLLFEHLRTSPVEVAAVLPLDGDRRPLGVQVVGVGTLNRVDVPMRDILGPAVSANATGIIYAHTHPSGDPRPSKADERYTKALRLAADTVGVELLDHLILAPRRSYAFADRGHLPSWSTDWQ